MNIDKRMTGIEMPYQLQEIESSYQHAMQMLSPSSLGLNSAISSEWEKAKGLIKENMDLVKDLQTAVNSCPAGHPFAERDIQNLTKPTAQAVKDLENILKGDYKKNPNSKELLMALKGLTAQLEIDRYEVAEKLVNLEDRLAKLDKIENKVNPQPLQQLSQRVRRYENNDGPTVAKVILTAIVAIFALRIIF